MEEIIKGFTQPTEEELKNSSAMMDEAVVSIGDAELDDVVGGKMLNAKNGVFTTRKEAELFIATFKVGKLYRHKEAGKVLVVSTGAVKKNGNWIGVVYFRKYIDGEGPTGGIWHSSRNYFV